MAETNGVHINGDIEHEPASTLHENISPYASQAVNVRIGPNGTNYTILQALIDEHPGLQARINQKQPGSPIELPEVDEEVAHTFVHFIYRQEYQCLGLGGIPENARAAAEFKRSVLAYCAARLCSIERLEEVTRSKMEHFSGQIAVSEIQDVVSQTSTKLPQNEVWFPEHLYRWVKISLQKNDELVLDGKILDLIGKSSLFDKAVVRSLADMYSETSAAVKLIPSTKKDAVDGDVTPVANGEHGLVSEHALPDHELVADSDAAAGDADVSQPVDHDNVETESGTTVEPSSELASTANKAEPDLVEGVEADALESESTPVASLDSEVVVDDNAVSNDKEDELARVDSVSKATDSDVEAARAKTTTKKPNKKKKKKNGGEVKAAS